MFKSIGGFTLVELIVVIAILGLLAGIAVPAYNKYIEKAQTQVESIEGVIGEREGAIDAAAAAASMSTTP